MTDPTVEAVAKLFALHDGWTKWDTAKTFNDTLSGNEPEDERENYRSRAALSIEALKALGWKPPEK